MNRGDIRANSSYWMNRAFIWASFVYFVQTQGSTDVCIIRHPSRVCIIIIIELFNPQWPSHAVDLQPIRALRDGGKETSAVQILAEQINVW